MVTEMTLKERITAMLKENTGTHFLDSGGAYGRHWERNQKRDFEKEPACWFEVHEYNGKPELEISYNLWHYLVNFLDYDDVCAKLNKEFMDFANLPQWKEETWEDTQNAWTKTQEFSDLWSEYTYNSETLLDQDIVYVHFEYEGDDYIFLRIHGGCDARGGFTAPVIFKVDEMDYFIMAQNDCELYANDPIDKN